MKLVILDRDGTLNHDSDEYIKSPEEWQALPGALRSGRAFESCGLPRGAGHQTGRV